MKQQKKLWVMAAILFIICGACVITCCGSKDDSPAVSPTDDSSQFVTLTDVVPDAILEIRYYGTYNFVGQRGGERRRDGPRLSFEDLRCLPSAEGC